VGQPLSQVLEKGIGDPAQLLTWLVSLSDTLANGRRADLNLPVQFSREGSTVQLVGTMVPWEGPGSGERGALVLFHDSALHADLNGARSRFLAVVAHELGAPVTNITAAAEQMARHLTGDEAGAWRLLEIIRTEGRRLERLLNGFLAGLDAEAQPADPPVGKMDIVALPPLLRQVASTFGLRDRGKSIVVRTADDLPFVWGDADDIQQALGNLVDNASRYAPASSEIVLAAEAQGEAVVVRVMDRGPGLSPEEEASLFATPRWGNGRQRSAEGRGLGLPIARAVIRSLGGALRYERGPEGMTCFCFTLSQVPGLVDEEKSEDGKKG
jgi:signal transduction histidine kinase